MASVIYLLLVGLTFTLNCLIFGELCNAGRIAYGLTMIYLLKYIAALVIAIVLQEISNPFVVPFGIAALLIFVCLPLGRSFRWYFPPREKDASVPIHPVGVVSKTNELR